MGPILCRLDSTSVPPINENRSWNLDAKTHNFMEFVYSDNISVHDKKQYQTFIVNVYSMYVIDFPAFKAAILNNKIALF